MQQQANKVQIMKTIAKEQENDDYLSVIKMIRKHFF